MPRHSSEASGPAGKDSGLSCKRSKVGLGQGEEGMGHRKSPEGQTWDSTKLCKAGVRLRPCHHGSQEEPDLSCRLQGDAEGSEAGVPERISLEHSRSVASCSTQASCAERHLL